MFPTTKSEPNDVNFIYHMFNPVGMRQKRVLAIHDISCVGKCSLTVALPIISATGIECSVIPTAVLSTHTGGFTGYTYRDLTADIVPIVDHWGTLDIRFDAIYTGFLGSFEQISIVAGIFDRMKDSVKIVDPVMADGGKMYPIFDLSFAKEMRKLCEKADVIMPNITEAVFMLGEEYVEGPYTMEYIEGLMDRLAELGPKRVILTGVHFDDEKLGAATLDRITGERSFYFSDRIPGYYHGTGDVFGSAVVGALMNAKSLSDSVRIAVDFTVSSIKRTYDAKTDVRFGVNFEEGLPQLVDDVLDNSIADIVSELATMIWNEWYQGIITQEQIDYMLNTYHSRESIEREMDEGYEFIIMKDGDMNIGYLSFHDEGDRVYISKLYLLKDFRGKGFGRRMFQIVDNYAKSKGIHKEYLRVNKKSSTLEVYKRSGFEIVDSVCTDLGNGFFMDDYIMEKRI